MAKGQRKQKQEKITQKSFEEMCKIQCTEAEMCAILDCSIHTLDNWCHNTYGHGFCYMYKRFSCNGKMSLRRNQMKLSETSAAMAIWLGKQMLGQTDTLPEENNTDDVNVERRTLEEIRKHKDEDCEVQQEDSES